MFAAVWALIERGSGLEAGWFGKVRWLRQLHAPDLMAWDPGSRLNLKGLANQGVVAVRYEATGCDVRLEVLSNCIGEGKYEYEPYAANQGKLVRNAQELFTELPLGAAALSGKLKNGRALRTDYMLVGMRQLKAGTSFDRSQLKGACAKATHVVNRLYVGGFAMMAGETQSLEAAASVFGVGAGGKQTVAGEVVNNEGVAEACAEAQKSAKESAQCGVPLRLGLVALGAIQTVCPEGTEQKGDQCVRKVAAVECPAGSKWDGSRCVATAAPVSATAAPSKASAGGMVRIPAGVFMMGSNDGRADEKPVHQVRVSAFEMDGTEVTVGAYRACVNAGRCSASSTVDGDSYFDEKRTAFNPTCNWGRSGRDNHPMNCVDWNQATGYCAYAGKRLPTEEEWEYAARGTDGRTYPWGNGAPAGQLCWMRWNGRSGEGTCAVGGYPSGDSPFGLHDMAGNVSEWTSSGYSEDYGRNRASGNRVHRGGGWVVGFIPDGVRGAHRGRSAPTDRDSDLGFRCAR